MGCSVFSILVREFGVDLGAGLLLVLVAGHVGVFLVLLAAHVYAELLLSGVDACVKDGC